MTFAMRARGQSRSFQSTADGGIGQNGVPLRWMKNEEFMLKFPFKKKKKNLNLRGSTVLWLENLPCFKLFYFLHFLHFANLQLFIFFFSYLIQVCFVISFDPRFIYCLPCLNTCVVVSVSRILFIYFFTNVYFAFQEREHE